MSEILARLIEKPVGRSFEFGGYRVARATNHLESIEIFRLRYCVYLESGYISAEDFPEPILCDEFDANSSQIAVRDTSGMLVGAARFVAPSPLGFHTQKVFDLDLPPIDRTRIGEFGRLVVRIGHRGGDRLVMLAVLKAVFECMIENGTSHILAFLPPNLADSFSALGCKPSELVAREPSGLVLQHRSQMRRYFEVQDPVPVLYDLEQMLDDVGVRRAAVADRLSLGSALSSCGSAASSVPKESLTHFSRSHQPREANHPGRV